MTGTRKPGSVWRLMRVAVPREWRDSIAGDLEEEQRRRRLGGRYAGCWWMFTTALGISLRLGAARALARRTPGQRRQPQRAVMEALAADLRHAARGLAKNRGFALTAVITLALGIGANAAVFTAAWHVILKPLPWPQSDRLVQIWNTSLKNGAVNVLAPANYLDIARESTTLDAIAAYTFFNYTLNLTGAGHPIEARVRGVTGDYFRIFGTPPQLGRVLDSDDARTNRAVIVIGDGLWRRQFGGAADVLHRRVQLDDRSYDIVGVMPPTFDPAARPVDGWVPYSFTPELAERRMGYFLAAVGRLKAVSSPEQARAEIAAIAARAAIRYPASNQYIGATARPLREELSGSLRTGFLLLACCATLVLLIACSNFASLQIARAGGMGRELAIRAAVGATRMQLARLLVTESMLVALAAGAAGLTAGLWTVRAIAAAAPPASLTASSLTLDPTVALVTLIVSVASGLLVGCVAVLRSTGGRALDALRTRSGTDPSTTRLRSTLVSTQVALATALVIVALGLVASLANVLRVDYGFRPEGVIVADLRLPPSRYGGPELQARFFEDVLARVAADPAVQHTCATNTVPLEQAATMTYVPDGTETLVGALPLTVTADCFAALGIPLRRGRLFEHRESTPVAIVSEGYARRAWPGEDGVGKRIRIGIATGDRLEVIGVVADSRRVSLETESYGQVYQVAHQARFFAPARVVIRSTAPIEAVSSSLGAAVQAADPTQPVANVRRLDDVVTRSLGSRRFNVLLLGGFAAMAILLAAVGVYGLLAQLVAARRAEIGVRMVLGARPEGIVRLVTAGALRAVVFGVIIGVAGAWAGSRAVARFLFGVSATDPLIYAAAATLLIALSLVAAYLPIRRATRIDPIGVLRSE